MILSHKYRFIFIKTLKTAETSLEVMLSPHMSCSDILTPIGGEDEKRMAQGCGPRNYRGRFNPVPLLFNGPHYRRCKALSKFLNGRRFYQHMAAYEIRNRIPPRIWNGYFKFCIMRNPWDTVFSSYFFHRSTGFVAPDMDFDAYVKARIFRPNWDLVSIGGRIAADHVLRYENLSQDLPDVLEELGLRRRLRLPKRKTGIRPAGAVYAKHYTAETRELIANEFAPEIEAFGYTF